MTDSSIPTIAPEVSRKVCSFCSHQFDKTEQIVNVPCNIRAFKHEIFQVWRCPDCNTIHCLDQIDLNAYYFQYPYGETQLSLPFRLYYRNRLRQLKLYGLLKEHRILDYGCGANGLQVEYLQEKGYKKTFGYDPYSSHDSFGNDQVLKNAPFDFILLQDVIEHVENPHALLEKLNTLLVPNGYILIGTPNAANIDLTRPCLEDYCNALHVPYHIHILTQPVLENLGRQQGWEIVEFSNRSYADTRWFTLNPRATSYYQHLCDGTMNVLFEPIKFWKLLTSPKFIFYAIFGFWCSYRTDMSITFRKRK